jgi:transcriptional regulator with XRE-family HTH domain
MKQDLGTTIRELRRSRGLTQRQLAEAVELDFTYLSKIENSTLQYSPSVKTLKKLAEALGAEELELLRLADKLPTGVKAITHSEQGIRFLRQASKVKDEEWDELSAFLERRRRERAEKKDPG